ncbi:MAG: NAD(P)H-dependent oxidoreductase [Lachnospiraceae bacterium]|nr:NAD(P)H-dependent oxidoreductase [Lachnospiraceae bacterium]
MNITVINGTEIKGVTFKMKELFLEHLRDKADITEFYLPKDCPSFCMGCKTCFLKDEHKCKDREYVEKIENAMLEADLLIFTSPAYVFHTTGAMKTMLDHFGYRWMPHRPAKEMFGKRAVIITQCLGSGEKSTAKDIKDSLSWWGISDIRVISFKLMSEIDWNRIPKKRRVVFEKKLYKSADKVRNIDYTIPARSSLPVKLKFYMVRMLQTGLGKTDPEYTDYKYWKQNGWIDDVRPWKQ